MSADDEHQAFVALVFRLRGHGLDGLDELRQRILSLMSQFQQAHPRGRGVRQLICDLGLGSPAG